MTQRQRREVIAQLEPHRGSWVVLRGAKVVASAPTLKELDRREPRRPGDRRLAVPSRHTQPYFRR